MKGGKFLRFAKKVKAPTVSVMAVPTDAEMLAFFRGCTAAKPVRAAALHYSRTRSAHGSHEAVTEDAELNVYRQALALAEEVQRKIVRRK